MSFPRYVLVANTDSNNLSVFSVDSGSGRLQFRSYVSTGDWPVAVVVHPSGAFAYVANSAVPGQPSSNTISAYQVQSNGTVTAIGGQIATMSTPVSVVIGPNGKHLYVTCTGATAAQSGIEIFAINQTTGALSTLSSGGTLAGISATAMAVNASGSLLCVLNRNASEISTYQINASTGTLLPVGRPIATGKFPNAVLFSASGQFVYVASTGATAGTGAVTTYSLNAVTGVLTARGSVVPGQPWKLLLHSSGNFLYVLNEFLTAIVYRVDQTTGVLSQISVTTLQPAQSTGIQYSSNFGLDPTGRYLYVTFYAAGELNTVTVYAINLLTGTLSEVQGGAISSGGTWPAAVAVIAGQSPVSYVPMFAYVTNQNDNTISSFQIDSATGSMTALGAPISVAVGPGSIVLDSAGQFAYFLAQPAAGGASSIYTYAVNKTSGALTASGAALSGTSPQISSLTIDPLNRFLFAITSPVSATNPSAQISTFSIHSVTGALKEISSIAVSGLPMGLAVDPTGSFVYCTINAGTVNAYAINASGGTLSLIGSVAGGAEPIAVMVDATSRFAYVADWFIGSGTTFSSGISCFTIQPKTGALTPIGWAQTVPNFDNANGVTVDPSGRFVYVPLDNNGSTNVAGYVIDQTTGLLSPMAGNPFVSGAVPKKIAVDASGKFAYSVNFHSANVSGYAIDQTNGQLSQVGGSPFPAGNAPTSMAILTVLQ